MMGKYFHTSHIFVSKCQYTNLSDNLIIFSCLLFYSIFPIYFPLHYQAHVFKDKVTVMTTTYGCFVAYLKLKEKWYQSDLSKFLQTLARKLQCMPLIPAAWEAEAGISHEVLDILIYSEIYRTVRAKKKKHVLKKVKKKKFAQFQINSLRGFFILKIN